MGAPAPEQLPGPQRVARAHTEEGEERSLPEPCAVCVYPLRPRSRPCRREELRLTRGNVTCPRPHSCEGHQQDWQPGRLAPGNIRCGACLVMTDGTPGLHVRVIATVENLVNADGSAEENTRCLPPSLPERATGVGATQTSPLSSFPMDYPLPTSCSPDAETEAQGGEGYRSEDENPAFSSPAWDPPWPGTALEHLILPLLGCGPCSKE
ncbi:uncharacterized protein LOC111164914 isoform X3 [Delphinapterus leucas]|uniref:Uncharacterized protein LOC111164914 isoform X3 n=1 Tax=Delphinapterus leucas TaxID=9749 RepID=A0A2Y9LPL1_DELLE|nr:uncharacterized protein LOC111164914 isoform X3 [Delphinapterus leucas]